MSFFKKAREPINSFTHLLGSAISVVGLLAIVIRLVYVKADIITAVFAMVFCVSLIMLYTTSGVYHFSNSAPAIVTRLKKLDHAMIFVLIAGTYTPVLYSILDKKRALISIGLIWAGAIVGILLKVFFINMPRILSTGLYILMGWAIIFDPRALANWSKGGIILLLLGGISYTIGGVIYWLKKPNISKIFAYHELFHIFILAGSVFHYFTVFFYAV